MKEYSIFNLIVSGVFRPFKVQMLSDYKNIELAIEKEIAALPTHFK